MTNDTDHLDVRHAARGVLLAAFSGTQVPSWIRDADGLGGVCLFADNTPDAPTAARLVADLRAVHPHLVVAIDEEGGDVTRIEAATGSHLPGASALGAVDDVVLTRAVGGAIGGLLAACDIDLTLAPVVDLATDTGNVMLASRAIAADPQVVARHGAALVAGIHDAGTAACVKHAPGHGDTATDSHQQVPTVTIDADLLHSRELVPFRAAIAAGTDAIMLAHLLVPALAPELTSLDATVPRLLRSEGFTGAIITDALDMGAVLDRTGGDLGEAAVRALLAGADLLCLGSPARIGREQLAAVVDAIVVAVESGRLDLAALTTARERVAALRRRRSGRPSVTDALAELARTGTFVTQRAAHAHGEVTLHPGDGLVDLRFRADYAASSTHEVAPRILTERLGLVPGEPAGRRLAVLTKDAHSGVTDLLARRPDAVVVHVGYPDSAPQAEHLVVVHGAGAASAAEAARLCSPDGDRPGWQDLVTLRSPTEERNPRTTELDTLDASGVVAAVLAEDATVARAVAAAADEIAALVDLGVAALSAGGRVHYVGAGTSGRLGAIDAAELLPTYGVGTEGFVAHLAGGEAAMLRAVEGVEDDAAAGAATVADVGAHDLVIGVAASGRTPFVGGALAAARAAGARTGLLSTNPHATLAEQVDVAVLIDTGPEAVTGSTRMKAGTATKMAINAFSTAVMVRLGKTFGNLMIDVAPTNDKLRARCVRMLVQATGAPEEQAAAALAEAGDVRTALVMLGARVGADTAREALSLHPPDPARAGDPGGIRTATRSVRAPH